MMPNFVLTAYQLATLQQYLDSRPHGEVKHLTAMLSMLPQVQIQQAVPTSLAGDDLHR